MRFKIFLRSFFIQTLWNFQTMQALGFLFVIKPFLDFLYKDDERKKAYLRHMRFFNTHPYFASFIVGITMRKEEEYKEKREEKILKEIENWKLNVAGPLAALGDSLIWSGLRPFIGVISVFLFFLIEDKKEYLFLVPLLFFIFYNAVHIFVRFKGIFKGYELKERIFEYLERLRLKEIGRYMRLFGVVFSFLLFLYLYFSPPIKIFSFINFVLFVILIYLARKLSVEVIFYLLVIAGYLIGIFT
ncbi:MAG: hypothetical protein DRI36_05225 [Caldiserica bacterium]|nr:MAG: hypothetical protein DRI36_05225 [Caldisericota bacterium]